jgi:hypothetical protein
MKRVRAKGLYRGTCPRSRLKRLCVVSSRLGQGLGHEFKGPCICVGLGAIVKCHLTHNDARQGWLKVAIARVKMIGPGGA